MAPRHPLRAAEIAGVSVAVAEPAVTGVAAARAPGLLALELRCDPAGRTRLVRRRQRFPLRTTVAMHLDERDPAMAYVYVQNPSGGVFGGDRLRVDVAAGPGARVHLTGQSATKLCRGSTGGHALQELHIDIGAGAIVEHIPDALIPHPGARYRQRTEVHLAAGATFIGSEILAPGRLGERFLFAEVDLRTTVQHEGREVCADAVRFAPVGSSSPARSGVLGRYSWLVSVLAVAPRADGNAVADRLDAALASQPDVLAAAGVLPGQCGAIVRVLADGALPARRALLCAWSEIRDELLGLPLPPLRK